MITVKQLLKKSKKIQKKLYISILKDSPQKKGICLKIYIKNPKKPNSADRKVAKVQLSNKKIITAYIPGEKHVLQQHSIVLIKGGKIKDLPGVNYRIVKNAYDFIK